MKPSIQLPGIMLSFSLLFACKKNSHDTTPGPNGTKLSKVIVWSFGQPVTSISVYQYRYDAMNRVTEISLSVGDSASGETQAKPYETTKWFYNGNEQQPYRRTDNSGEHYYSYDDKGRLVYDSLGFANCTCYDLKKYNWSNNKIIGVLISGISGSSNTIFDSSVISDKNYLARYNLSAQPSTNLAGAQYIYDNKSNPLHTLNIHNAVAFSVVGGIPTTGYNENNNNEVSYGYRDTYGPGPVTFVKTQVLTYKYTYNSYNLPVDCEISGNTPVPSKIKFFYTN